MAQPVSKKASKKPGEEDDPVNGIKFDEPDMSSVEHQQTLAFRGKFYSELVIVNSNEKRAKSALSKAFWIDKLLKAHVPQSKGKHFINMGHSGKTEDGQPTIWLFPEETLWMLEHGHIELTDEQGNAVRRRWLWERFFCRAPIEGFTPMHYSAYCHMRNSGYVVRRWNKRAPTPEMSKDDPSCWDLVEKENSLENGYIVFEVWPPSMAAGFSRKNPPKSCWKLLPWKLDSNCFPAEAWSKVAGEGSMIALSGTAGSRCSFFQVHQTKIESNVAAKQPILKKQKGKEKKKNQVEKKEVVEVKEVILGEQLNNNLEKEQGKSNQWFCKASDWMNY